MTVEWEDVMSRQHQVNKLLSMFCSKFQNFKRHFRFNRKKPFLNLPGTRNPYLPYSSKNLVGLQRWT